MKLKKHRKPKKVVTRLTRVARKIAKRLTGDEHDDLYVTDTCAGRCNNSNITIPKWAYTDHKNGRRGYFIHYIAHELAHRYADGWQHDDLFYEMYKTICPREYQHYELEYKPRNAAAAGIKRK